MHQHRKRGMSRLSWALMGAMAMAATAAVPAAAQEVVAQEQGGGNDPLFKYQWHLRNYGQGQGIIADTQPKYGVDLGIDDLHRHNIRGRDVTIAIVDDGLQIAHPDLAPNVAAVAGKNFVDGSNDPSPKNPDGDNHGTMVGGIAGAAGYNGVGVRGVAPYATLKGFNFLESGSSMSSDDKHVYSWWEGDETRDVDVFNNSWGAGSLFGVYTPLAFSELKVESFDRGMASTRGGLGGIYVKSAGNDFFGRNYLDTCHDAGCIPANRDPRNNLFNTITVAAVRADGKKSTYSSTGSAVWVSAFGGEFGGMAQFPVGPGTLDLFGDATFEPAILTTDVMGCDAGSNKNEGMWRNIRNLLDTDQSEIDSTCNYTAKMSGTSAAAPMISGVAALMLEANPELTYRDVKYILATTARQIDSNLRGVLHPDGGEVLVPGWTVNAAGHAYSNWYGFGLVDAAAAVFKAADFKTLPPLVDSGWTAESPNDAVAIGGRQAPARIAITLTEAAERVESVQLGFALDGATNQSIASSMQVTLVSPSGTRSVVQPAFTNITGLSTWDFNSSNAFLDEAGAGEWTLEVTDVGLADGAASRARLNSFKIRVLGH